MGLYTFTITSNPTTAEATAPGLEATVPWDLALDASGDLADPPRWVKGAEAVCQRVVIRLRKMLGEWFLDTREGVPYLQTILQKGTSLDLAESILRRVILETPGVATITVWEAAFDRVNRALDVTFEARLTDGTEARFQVTPFVVGS